MPIKPRVYCLMNKQIWQNFQQNSTRIKNSYLYRAREIVQIALHTADGSSIPGTLSTARSDP